MIAYKRENGKCPHDMSSRYVHKYIVKLYKKVPESKYAFKSLIIFQKTLHRQMSHKKLFYFQSWFQIKTCSHWKQHAPSKDVLEWKSSYCTRIGKTQDKRAKKITKKQTFLGFIRDCCVFKDLASAIIHHRYPLLIFKFFHDASFFPHVNSSLITQVNEGNNETINITQSISSTIINAFFLTVTAYFILYWTLKFTLISFQKLLFPLISLLVTVIYFLRIVPL